MARIQAYFPYRRSIASDDEYVLFGVVVFKRVHDEFVQKCRENKLEPPAFTVVGSCLTVLFSPRFIVRDFVYSEAQITKQREELDMADTTEKELWVSYATRFWKISRLFVVDGAPSSVQDKFLGIIPDSRPLEGHPPFC
jgi:hypothetical protein